MENTSINALNRPVMAKDIAEKLGLPVATVKNYLSKEYPWNGKTVRLVRETAAQMGYDPKKALEYTGKMSKGTPKPHSAMTQQKIADAFGTSIASVNRALKGKLNNKELAAKILEYALQHGYENHTSPEYKAKKAAEKAANTWWCSTAFRTREEMITYMTHLRDLGFGNMEIAKKAGVTPITVRRNIGATPAELAKHNRTVGAKLGVVKRMARAVYIRNKSIAEYNAKVDERNALKEKMEKLEAEIAQQQPAVEKLAAKKIPVPQLDLAALSPTALM